MEDLEETRSTTEPLVLRLFGGVRGLPLRFGNACRTSTILHTIYCILYQAVTELQDQLRCAA